jgi:hypothetical protein
MILTVPWLVISVVLYNIIALIAGGEVFSEYTLLTNIHLISGAHWSLKLSDLMVVITLAILFVELIKATRTGETSIIDHSLSMLLFIVCVVEFLTVKDCGTSTFFIITVITLIDVVAGFTITIRAARRDLALGGTHQ